MDDKRARHDLGSLARRLHRAAALEAEIDLGGIGVAVIWAGLPGLPAGDGDIALGDAPEDPLHLFFGVEFLLGLQVEDMHRLPPRAAAKYETVSRLTEAD